MNLLTLLALSVTAQETQPQIRVVVHPETAEVEVDGTTQLRAEVYDSAGVLLQDPEVRWFAVDGDLVSVDAQGLVTALSPGQARVVVGMPGQGFTTARITVPQLPPVELSLSIADAAIKRGASAQLDAVVKTRLGHEISAPISYASSRRDIATVDGSGRVFTRAEGRTIVSATAGDATGELEIRVVRNRASSYRISVPSGSVRTGDVVRLAVEGVASNGDVVSGFSPAWSVGGSGATVETDGSAGVFVAERPGTYRITALVGENAVASTNVTVEQREILGEVVTVGRGPVSEHHTGDTWVFEGVDGRDYAYIGTYEYDWMKVWDVTDPANPVLTDSVQLDARRINDVKVHPNGRIAIVTREGASDRRNGIVVLDLGNPAHPSILSEYTEAITGGVHNVWISGENNLVYACHNGTSELVIIDIADPSNPHEVGRWGLDRTGKTLHDVIVQDGYAYLSYWNDGIIMLDVGAGSHGGTPTEPTFVSQFKYPIGSTHTAWRYGRYLFVGDELYPPNWDLDRPVEARGYIHVVDYSDIEDPAEVARYEVPEAGAHNVWIEDDLLYVGYYQGGLRVVDISGELRGDLYAQGREIAALITTDENTVVPNWPMTWGAQVHKGHIFSWDLNSGIWVARYDRPELVP